MTPPAAHYRRWQPHEIDQLRAWYATPRCERVSVRTLARQLGRSMSSVMDKAFKNGFCPKRIGDIGSRVRDLWSEGMSDLQAARHLGVSGTSVRNWRVRLNLASNRPKHRPKKYQEVA